MLTHGHEDHIGAVPYFAADFGVPLYATPFTAGLILRKLEEAGLTDRVELNIIDATRAASRSARSRSPTSRSRIRSPRATRC